MGSNILVVPLKSKLEELSPTCADFYNTYHTALLDFEAVLPFVIDNINEFNEFARKDISPILLNFIEKKGYIKKEGNEYVKTGKSLEIDDTTIFGLLCYYSIYSHNLYKENSTSANVRTEAMLLNDIEYAPRQFNSLKTPLKIFKQKFKDFKQYGRDLNVINSSEYTKTVMKFDSFDTDYSLKEEDAKIIENAFNNFVSTLPNEIRDSIANQNNFNKIIEKYKQDKKAGNFSLQLFQSLFSTLLTAYDFSKIDIDGEIYDKLLDYVEKLIKVDIRYVLNTAKNLLNVNLYRNLSINNDPIEFKKTDFVAFKNQFLDKNSKITQILLDIGAYKETINKYISDIDNSFKNVHDVDLSSDGKHPLRSKEIADLFSTDKEYSKFINDLEILENMDIPEDKYDSLKRQLFNKSINEDIHNIIDSKRVELENYKNKFNILNENFNNEIKIFLRYIENFAINNLRIYYYKFEKQISNYLQSTQQSILNLKFKDLVSAIYDNSADSDIPTLKREIDTTTMRNDLNDVYHELSIYYTNIEEYKNNYKDLDNEMHSKFFENGMNIEERLKKIKELKNMQYDDPVYSLSSEIAERKDEVEKNVHDIKEINEMKLEQLRKERNNPFMSPQDSERDACTMFNNFVKKIIAASEKYTEKDFDDVFRFSEYLKVKNGDGLKNGISFIVTLAKIIIDHLALDAKNISQDDIKNEVEKLFTTLNKQPDLLEILPVSVTIDYLNKNKEGIIQQIGYILYNKNINNVQTNKATDIIEEVYKLKDSIQLTLGEKLGLKYIVNGDYNPEMYLQYLENNSDLRHSSKINAVNEGTLQVCNEMVTRFIALLQMQTSSDSIYLQSIDYLKSEIILNLLNKFPVYNYNEEEGNIIYHNANFLTNLLIPKFLKYLEDNRILTVQECYDYRVEKQYRKIDSISVKKQYANFFTIKSVYALIYKFMHNNKEFEPFFKLDLNTEKQRVYIDDLLFANALKTTGLFTFDFTVENTDTDKLLMLSKVFYRNPEEDKKLNKAEISSMDPFYMWNKLLRNFSQSYKLSTLYYVVLILNDLGCTKEFLMRLNEFQKNVINENYGNYAILQQTLNKIIEKYDTLVKSSDSVQNDLQTIAEDALNIIKKDPILSKYVSFNLKSFNLNSGEFEYSLNEREIENTTNGQFSKHLEVNNLLTDMADIIKGLKFTRLKDTKVPVDDLIRIAEQYYQTMISTTINKNIVTKELVENRVFIFNEKIKLYFSQLRQDFNIFKELCTSILEDMNKYTALYEEALVYIDENTQVNVNYEIEKINN